MKVIRTSANRISLRDLSAAESLVLLDALHELDRDDNPVKPFSSEMWWRVKRLTAALQQVATELHRAPAPPREHQMWPRTKRPRLRLVPADKR